MGKIIEFPCRDNDYYEEWNYEDYYANEEFEEQGYGNYAVQIKDGLVRGFVRKCLMFVLMRL